MILSHLPIFPCSNSIGSIGLTTFKHSSFIMAVSEAPSIRIAFIANRYLIFDPQAASLLRRQQNSCGNLVGTLHQQPTQNVFLGMPVEIRAEEAQALVARGAAYIVDDVAAHRAALRDGQGEKKRYIAGLRRQKMETDKALRELHAEREVKRAEMLAMSKKPKADKQTPPVASDTQANEESVFEQPKSKAATPTSTQTSPLDLWAITPTTSNDLLPPASDRDFRNAQPLESPFARYLQGSGYFTTPGLRFGCRYSVYPGDPLRFHAHYMANDYDWDEAIPILDIVEAGRLATAVKKSFLIGGEDKDQASPSGDGVVRAYSLEWAGM